MPTARHVLAAVSFDNKIFVSSGSPQPGGSGSNIDEVFHVGYSGR